VLKIFNDINADVRSKERPAVTLVCWVESGIYRTILGPFWDLAETSGDNLSRAHATGTKWPPCFATTAA